MKNQSDQKLIADYLEGGEKSLEILIGRHLRPVYSFICRWVGNPRDAEDITQEVFARAWRNLKKPVLGFSRGFNPEKGNFKTWIFGIARNASIDFLRKSRSASGERKEMPFSEFSARSASVFGGDDNSVKPIEDAIADPAPLPSEIFERLDAGRLLASALEKLSPEHRMVLYLRYNDHFNFREISESLGEPLNTIKSRHRRAVAMLKRILAGQ